MLNHIECYPIASLNPPKTTKQTNRLPQTAKKEPHNKSKTIEDHTKKQHKNQKES